VDSLPAKISQVAERLDKNKGLLLRKINVHTTTLSQKIKQFSEKFKSSYFHGQGEMSTKQVLEDISSKGQTVQEIGKKIDVYKDFKCLTDSKLDSSLEECN
jgi:predicted transcriptional regulator